MATDDERRRWPRYAVELPVEFAVEGDAWTQNLSANGVFFVTTAPVKLKTSIEFTLSLQPANSDPPVRLHCNGIVVRVEPAGDLLGVGASILSTRLVPEK